MKILILLSSLFLTAFASAEHRSDLRDAAHNLERATNNLLHKVEHKHDYAHINKDVAALAYRASRLHSHVERGASKRRLRKDFRRFSRRYQHVAHQLRHGDHHDRHMQRSLNRVARNFERVRYAMSNQYYSNVYNQNDFYQQQSFQQRPFQQRHRANNRRGGWRVGFSVNK